MERKREEEGSGGSLSQRRSGVNESWPNEGEPHYDPVLPRGQFEKMDLVKAGRDTR